MKVVKLATLALAVFAFAGAASACPFGKTSDKSAEAPIVKPSAGS